MKHTPGPWTNDNGLVCGQESRERFKPGPSVDLFNAADYDEELQEEMLGNTKLIAASLDMWTALQNIAGGFINTDFVTSNPPDWHSAFAQLQTIASNVIERRKLC